jgi:2-oxoglutarate/2-oxoacid ferredoxin oxidoreductase subunit alpha
VLVPELNLGQLALLLRGKFLVDIVSYTQLRGLPFQSGDLTEAIEGMVGQ